MSNIKRRLNKIEDKVGLSQRQIHVNIITFAETLPPDQHYGNYHVHHVPYNEYAKERGLPQFDIKEIRCKRKTSITE